MKQVLLKSGQTAVIRRPEPDDAEKMVRYLNAVGGESDFLLFGENEFRLNAEQERDYIENISGRASSIMLMALVDGEVAGIIVLNAPERKRIAHTSELSMSVAKRHWGKGIGAALLAEVIRFARETGILKVIGLSVRADNGRARALYAKMGFKEIGYYRDNIRIGDDYFDLVLMNLYL